jgi:heat-inducible transcriptional repressor
MSVVLAAEVGRDPIGQLLGAEQAVRLDHFALGVDPAWLDRIEPRALDRQGAGDDPYAFPLSLGSSVVLADPGSYLPTDVPGGVVTGHQERLEASALEPVADPVEELGRDRRDRPTVDEAQPDLLLDLRLAARADLSEAESLAGFVERSSHALSQITRNFGIAAAIPTLSQTLDQVELVKLADRRVLMIIVTKDRMVRDRVVTITDDLSQDELNSIRNYLNANFGGWALSEARQELRRRLEQESAAYDAILQQLSVLYSKGLLDVACTPEIHMEGASNLVGLDLHLTREKMRDLFRALEEKKRMLQLLDRFLERTSGELGVQVGLGEAHPAMGSLSLIGLKVVLPGGLSAKIAVLGPMRMNYERVMCAVWQVGSAFQKAVG